MTQKIKPPRLSMRETLFLSNAVLHLVPRFPERVTFVEPFSRSEILYRTLEAFGHECGGTYNVGFEEPMKLQVRADWALNERRLSYVDAIITMPPPMVAWRALSHFAELRPTWALIPGWLLCDELFNSILKQHCTDIYPVGHAPIYMKSWQRNQIVCAWVRLDKQSSGVVWHPASTGVRLKEPVLVR